MSGDDDDDVGALAKTFEESRRKVATIPEKPAKGPVTTKRGALRNRLTLRVSDEVSEGLDLIAMVGGVNKNAFCEAALVKAVRAKLAAMQGDLEPGEWDVVVKVMRRGRQGGGATGRGVRRSM